MWSSPWQIRSRCCTRARCSPTTSRNGSRPTAASGRSTWEAAKMLEVNAVDTYYGSSQILHGATLSVGEGEVVGLLGRNGMGKTTLVHTVAGLLKPRAGEITF